VDCRRHAAGGWDDHVWPWRYAVAFTVLMLANFAIYFLALKYGGGLGLVVATVPFLWFGYTLAAVIDARAR